jgi:hypothetical protein
MPSQYPPRKVGDGVVMLPLELVAVHVELGQSE